MWLRNLNSVPLDHVDRLLGGLACPSDQLADLGGDNCETLPASLTLAASLATFRAGRLVCLAMR